MRDAMTLQIRNQGLGWFIFGRRARKDEELDRRKFYLKLRLTEPQHGRLGRM